MKNSFLSNLQKATNLKYTENGAVAHKSTDSKLYDLFALGGAYRSRLDSEKISLFKKAFEENPDFALKCLFYLRDCRGGQGEREFFRVCFKWLINNHKDIALRNLKNISEFGRWDDLIYICEGTCLEKEGFALVAEQFRKDLSTETPSLLGKWMPSENTSSKETKRVAAKIRRYLKVSSRHYRKALSLLRKRINIVETLMSQDKWGEIQFDKLPSRAGLLYKDAFLRDPVTRDRYTVFMNSKETKVNASTLYPYEIVKKAIYDTYNPVNVSAINKYWENLPDYTDGNSSNTLCVVDTSGSMTCGMSGSTPLCVAISLGMYFAERCTGPFANHFITFSHAPQLVEVEGKDFVDKARRIYNSTINDNTNIEAVFDLLLSVAINKSTSKEDIPENIIIISDMEIDNATRNGFSYFRNKDRDPVIQWTKDNSNTLMENIREKWTKAGIECPHLIYWNVDARQDTILDLGPNVSLVSGLSPVIFKQVVSGKRGYDLMMEVLESERYECIK